MVAISIDKYLAIMYPMRLRMHKTQAKLIILVIWSAALMTSLPTALLSSLTSASESVASGSNTAVQANENAPLATQANHQQSSLLSTSTLTPDTLSANNFGDLQASAVIESTTIAAPNHSRGPNDIYRQDKFNISSSSSPSSPIAQVHQEQRPFCQESWNFWPPGKYFYSMALMILQFAIPLFVLVITYSRIVIVVWGKRMPGEEDNARDTKMARSKRKVNSNKCSGASIRSRGRIRGNRG